MLGLDGLIAGLPRQLGSLLQSLLSLFRESIQSHQVSFPKPFRGPNGLSVS